MTHHVCTIARLGLFDNSSKLMGSTIHKEFNTKLMVVPYDWRKLMAWVERGEFLLEPSKWKLYDYAVQSIYTS